MKACGGQINSGRVFGGKLLLGLCVTVFIVSSTLPGEAEIIRRDLGKNSKGETVSGYVFQAGRSHRRRSHTSNSVFGGRPVRYHRGRGIDYGYRYPLYRSFFYYSVPYSYSYPIHCHHPGAGILSVQVSF